MHQPRPERWLLIALIAATYACTPKASPEAPTPASERAGRGAVTLDDAEIQALAELIRLEDRREFDDATLNRYLAAGHPEIRRHTALALGRIGDPRGRALLHRALADPAATVRAEAAFALGQLGDSATQHVTPLAARALDPGESELVRAEAAAALGKLSSTAARSAIIEILEQAAEISTAAASRPPPVRVVEEALLASWRFRRTPELTIPIIRLARSPNPELRWRATYALMRLGDPASVEALLERRRDAEPFVRALAARTLRSAVVDSTPFRDDAVRALAEATRDAHPHVRINALGALARFKDIGSAELIGPRAADSDLNVRLAAVEALGVAGGPAAAAALEPIARDTTQRLAIRTSALTGLLRANPETALPIIGSLARAENWLSRFYATRALGAHATDAGNQILAELVHDPDPRVAANALNGLASIPPERAPEVERILVQQLGAADVGVRAAALRGLADRATAAHLPLLLDAYYRTRNDRENDAARAAITALGALASKGVPVQNSFFRRFQRSEDQIVRREVVEKLGPGNWGSATPVETGRGSDFYEEIARDHVARQLAGEPAPRVVIHTAGGAMTIELAAMDAPLTVHNFLTLAERGYFDGFRWHRVVPNFVLQDGDPRGDGEGGPGYMIRDEFNRLRYLRGTVGMALDGADTGGSQFFITHSPQPHLDGRYTIFGQVVEGIDVADRVAQDDQILRIEIVRSVASRPKTRGARR